MSRKSTIPALAGVILVCIILVVTVLTAVAAARSGHAMAKRTLDTRSATVKPLRSIDFISGLRGWTGSEGGQILRTTTGGTSWTTQRRYHASGNDILDLSFASRSRGWAAGTAGVLLRTTNGGAGWRRQVLTGMSDNLTSVKAVSGSVVWTCGGFASSIWDDAHPPAGAVWRSGTGGASWAHTDFAGFAPIALDATSALKCWAVGPLRHQTDPSTGYNTVAWTVTSDGGATWTAPAEIPNTAVIAGTPWGIDVRGATIVVVGNDAVAGAPVALFSVDAGASWSVVTWPAGFGFSDVQVVSSTTAYAIGVSRTVWKTTDSGMTWSPRDLPSGVTTEDLDFVSASVGYVAGRFGFGTETGRVYKTINGAGHWTRVR